MTEMKLRDGKFYLLDAGIEKFAYDSESDAIGGFKGIVGNGTNVDPTKVNIFEVDTKGDKWGIKQIPWSKIAIELVKGGK